MEACTATFVILIEAGLDGEVCALDADGKPYFETLQKPLSNTQIVFYTYDILWLNGYNLMDLPLIARKRILKAVLGKNICLRFSEHFTDGVKLFERVQDLPTGKRSSDLFM